MFKKITAALLPALLLLSAAACAGAKTSDTTAQTAANASDPAAQTAEETASSAVPDRLFDFDVTQYVKIPDVRSYTLKKEDVDAEAESYAEELAENNPVVSAKTEGTVEKDDITEIYYQGILIVYDGDVDLTVGETGIAGLDDEMERNPPAGGTADYELALPEDFALPEFMKRSNDLLDQELSGKTVTVRLSDLPETMPASGEQLHAHLRFEYIFPGGTFNEASNGGAGSELTIGSGKFIAGFEDGMIGMSVEAGSSRTVETTFPDPYRNDPALAGERADFVVRILSVKTSHICDLNDPDDFALFKTNYIAENGEGSFSYDSKAALMVDYTRRAKANLCYDLINNDVQPIKENEEELAAYKASVKDQLIMQIGQNYYSYIGRMLTEEEVITYFYGGDEGTFNSKIEESAKLYLHRHLTYMGVLRDLGLQEPTQEQVDKMLNEQVEYYTRYGYSVTAEDVANALYGGMNEVKKEIMTNTMLDWLTENVPVIG